MVYIIQAAGFLEIFAIICAKCPRKLRQFSAIILWFGILGIILAITIGFDPDTSSFYILCFIALGICFTFFIALFGFIKNDEQDLFLRDNNIDKKIDYDNYYLSKLCNICNTKCDILDITPYKNNNNNNYGNQCKICSTYLWKYDRSYNCAKCNTLYCINCGNVTLQSINIFDDNNDDLKKKENVSTILWSFRNDEYISYWIRLTWPNIISFIGIILDFY